MQIDRSRFVIVAQARSGSTLLQKALHAHPGIICHGEVLSRVWINRLVPPGQDEARRLPRSEVERLIPERQKDVTRFLERHVYNGFDGHMVGFKIVYGDLLKPFPLAIAALAHMIVRPVTTIHLYRANTLAAFVSKRRMVEFGASHSDAGDWSNTPSIIADRTELVEFAAEQASFHARAAALFPHALTVRYEDLRASFPAILRHLGVPDAPFVEQLRKLAPVDLREAVANYDEVADFDSEAA